MKLTKNLRCLNLVLLLFTFSACTESASAPVPAGTATPPATGSPQPPATDASKETPKVPEKPTTPVVSADSCTVTTSSDPLAIRSTPDKNGKLLGSASKGSTVTRKGVETKDGWLKIVSGKIEGYVCASCVKNAPYLKCGATTPAQKLTEDSEDSEAQRLRKEAEEKDRNYDGTLG